MINLILINILALLCTPKESLLNITNIIALKFHRYEEPYIESKELNISSLIKNHIYTEIEVGGQILVASFNSDEYGFYMTDEDCIEKSNYIIQKSATFTNLSKFDEGDSGYASEIFSLYRDKDFTIKQNGYFKKMYISKYNHNRQCAVFGLKINTYIAEWDSKPNFINTYHNNGNILNKKWTMKYETNDEGTLIVGDSPDNYDPSFKKKKYIEYSTYAIQKASLMNFGIKFDEISINGKTLDVIKEVHFYHEYNAILVNSNYYNKIKPIFFEKYISQNKCNERTEFSKYSCIYCHKNFTDKDKKSFPTIYFKHVELNTIFELNHNDLFTKAKDGKLYFLIVMEINSDNIIKFGKPFLKKYTFTVDNEANKISLFAFEKKQKRNYLLIIILSVVSFVLLAAVIILVYKLLTKKAKKRANELDDDYEYMTKEEENKNTNNDPEIPLANNLGL